MIIPIEMIPESEGDKKRLIGAKLKSDVLEIIERGIRMCEIKSDYSTSSMRSGLKAAIRRAVYSWNQSHERKVDYDELIIHRRKAEDGSAHWYIEYTGGGDGGI